MRNEGTIASLKIKRQISNIKMNSSDIRKKFLEYFRRKGHVIVPSSSLIPDDPSVLLTTAGMQQFKPYFVGKADPIADFGSKNVASVQKSFRTSDIDEVGDESHLTFFEMLGNFSFGGPLTSDTPSLRTSYFKKGAIEYAHEFIAKEMGLTIDYVSVFKGDDDVPADTESEEIWKSLGVANIKKMGREDNFWGPTGNEGPCGPTTEIYVNGLEVWNIVFNEFYCDKNKKLTPLKIKGVDTGMGLERLVMVVQKKSNIFETDLFSGLTDLVPTSDIRLKRILADHLRASVHLIADGVEPSNKERGYILRRILRRAALHAMDVAFERAVLSSPKSITSENENEKGWFNEIAALTADSSYFAITDKKSLILKIIEKEVGQFSELLKSQKEVERLIQRSPDIIPGQDAFHVSSTYGPPIDYIQDQAIKAGKQVNLQEFELAREKHQEISRAGQEKKFGGHGLLLDTGELKAGNEEELKKVTRLHTATHMLQQALREVLGPEVKQMGSDITVERTRFDFTFSRKLTPEEIKKSEEIVNRKIKEDLPMQKVVLPKAEAEKTGALFFFKGKYPDPVNVYFIGKNLETAWSKEFCGGPHVGRTGEIGEFKITKEEAVGAGVRRIRGIVVP